VIECRPDHTPKNLNFYVNEAFQRVSTERLLINPDWRWYLLQQGWANSDSRAICGPFCSTSTSLYCQTPSPKSTHAHDLAIMHAVGDSQAVAGVLTQRRHGNRKRIPPDPEATAQHCKNGISSLPSQQQGS